MTKTNFLYAGKEGAIYPLEKSNDVMKILFSYSLVHSFRNPEKWVQENYDSFKDAKEQGLRVPQVRDIVRIKGENLEIPKIFKKFAKKQNLDMDGMHFYGIVKEFITGKCLGNNFIHSMNLQSLVQQTYKDFLEKEYVITDARPSNFILKQENELYMIDEGSLHTIDEAKQFGFYKENIFGHNTFYGDKLLLGCYLAESLVQVGKTLLKKNRR